MRKETSLPLKNCREALVETNWDFEAAKLYLKKEAKRLGLKKMASLASRATSEGLVGGALVETNWDFEAAKLYLKK